MIALAASITYFSFALITINEQLPEVLKQTNASSQKISDIVKVVDGISTQIPDVLAEVKQLRQQIPIILDEVSIVNKQIPLVLQESAAIRQQIPSILDEMAAYRALMPTILDEVATTRETIPTILAEVAAVRETIPPTLDRMDLLVDKVDGVSKDLGENAVQNVFAGIIKAPFRLVQSLGEGLSPDQTLSDADKQLVVQKSLVLLNNGKIGQISPIKSDTSELEGEVKIVAEKMIDGQYCRELKVTLTKLLVSTYNVCKDKDDQWQLIRNAD